MLVPSLTESLPKPPVRRRPRGTGSINRSVLRTLTERMEAAIQADQVELVEEPSDVPHAAGPAVDTRSFAAILAALFPEEFAEQPHTVLQLVQKVARRTATAPASPERILAYRERAAAQVGLFHADDADPIRTDRLSLRAGARSNGHAVKIGGWWGETDADDGGAAAELTFTELELAELERRRAKRGGAGEGN
ncbi:MAG: hypothetical protein E6R03_01700 [Hyphomicrobiaceae bacterium]|nr:MAG: hypothetical protein E6R03_01700 [Hyphomicrobiaceae bacterium]